MTSEGRSADGQVIVVMGATGRQGGAVARRLIADGWTVRGVTRRAGSPKADRLRTAGVEVVQADMDERSALVGVIQGAHGLYSVQNPMTAGYAREVPQGKNVADAAREVGIEHVVYASAGPGRPATGVQQWDNKLEIADHMRSLGLPLTVLRPMAFMELMTDKDFYPNVSTWHVMPKLLGWDHPVPWVAVDDLAVIAAAAFSNPAAFVGREIPVAADIKTLEECRVLWREARGRAPRGFPMPVRLFERFVGGDLTRMWRWLRDNELDVDVSGSREIHPTMVTVEQWLRPRVAARDDVR